jgi:hypothetical protein
MAKKPAYEDLVPDDVRKLAEGVGLPEPTWYDGRTNGHEIAEAQEGGHPDPPPGHDRP